MGGGIAKTKGFIRNLNGPHGAGRSVDLRLAFAPEFDQAQSAVADGDACDRAVVGTEADETVVGRSGADRDVDCHVVAKHHAVFLDVEQPVDERVAPLLKVARQGPPSALHDATQPFAALREVGGWRRNLRHTMFDDRINAPALR